MSNILELATLEDLRSAFRTLSDKIERIGRSVDTLCSERLELKAAAAKGRDARLSVRQVCEILNVARPTLLRWEKNGILTPMRRGGKVYYSEADVMDMPAQPTRRRHSAKRATCA